MAVNYGRAMAVAMAVTEVPIIAGLLIGLFFPRYFMHAVIGGVGTTAVLVFVLLVASTLKARELQRIGLTLQYADGSDAYYDIIYSKMPVDISHLDNNGKHVYLIVDLDGNDWILQMDHPLEEIIARLDSMPYFAGMPTPILTRFVTGASISENVVKDDVKPSILQRILRRKPKADRMSREVLVYATPVTVKREKHKGVSFDGAKSLFKDVVSYAYIEQKKELDQLKDHNEELTRMLDEHLPIMLKTKPFKIEDSAKLKVNWKLVGAVIGVALVVAALYYLGVIR